MRQMDQLNVVYKAPKKRNNVKNIWNYDNKNFYETQNVTF